MLTFMVSTASSQTKMTVTTTDGKSYVSDDTSITFDYDHQNVNFETDHRSLMMSEIQGFDFMRDRLPWNMMWKYTNNPSYAYDYGYP